MSDARLLGWSALNRLFTILICINEDGDIVFASDIARHHMAQLDTQKRFFDVFTPLRPIGAHSVRELRAHLDSLFLMKTRDESFAVRGQMLETQFNDETLVCFCGAPWLLWINANCPNLKLQMSDFSPQDSQLDQLFMMTTEQRMVHDLEKLNSELKRAKRDTERAQEAKNALFARMSHEMRTPLNGVVSALALLSDKAMEADARSLLNLAESSSRNLLHVINYVLDISKIEAGDNVLEAQPMDLASVLRSVTDIVRARAVEKGLDLHWTVDEDLAPTYLGDRDKLRQCLLNLVTNAIRFTGAGKVEVRAVPAGFDNDDCVRFEVEDSGVGISQEDRQRIFEPFWTKGEADGEAATGTGLGLDIVRRNVELMGGSLGLQSEEGTGSMFWLEIPMESSEKPAATVLEPVMNVLNSKRIQGQILLVDDNNTNLMLGRMILESIGATVTTAVNGAEALAAALAHPYDMILMDLNMPLMDGIEATQHIRQQFDSEVLPIIALTAYANTDEKDRCLAAGMNDYLTKPIVRDRLIEKLSPWLGERALGDASGSAAPNPKTRKPHGTVDEPDFEEPEVMMTVLEDLGAQIGDEGLRAVITQFEAEARTRSRALQQARDSEDTRSAIREAHTLGSTCYSLGLVAAGDLFSSMEKALRDNANVTGRDCAEAVAALERGLATIKGRSTS